MEQEHEAGISIEKIWKASVFLTRLKESVSHKASQQELKEGKISVKDFKKNEKVKEKQHPQGYTIIFY